MNDLSRRMRHLITRLRQGDILTLNRIGRYAYEYRWNGKPAKNVHGGTVRSLQQRGLIVRHGDIDGDHQYALSVQNPECTTHARPELESADQSNVTLPGVWICSF